MAHRDRARIFGEAAEAYERFRPSYPRALIEDLLALAPAQPSLLDIGAGTAKATRLLAPFVTTAVAVEPDAAMAAVARRVCAPWPQVAVRVESFETCTIAAGSVDLAIAAQSWHWVDHAVALPKLATILRGTGVLALFWNRPIPESSPVRDEMESIYQRFTPESIETTPVCNGDLIGLDVDTAELTESGVFASTERRDYEWSRRYDADQYAGELSTHSDLLVLESDRRAAMLAAIHAAVARLGTIDIAHTTELIIGCRPPPPGA